jgi:hypothetical protein
MKYDSFYCHHPLKCIVVVVVVPVQIDVEGSELRVLKGISSAHWRLVQRVSVEVHDVGTRIRDVMRLLIAPLKQLSVRVEVEVEGELEGLSKSGGGFDPSRIILHRPPMAHAGMNNHHIFAWR